MQNDDQGNNQSDEYSDAQEQTPAVDSGAQLNEADLLASVRERALSKLTSLLPDLKDIAPEQKFLISMSALRSTDNISLLESALQAAQAIKDKELQANSLLDLINEVNYQIDSRKPTQAESDNKN